MLEARCVTYQVRGKSLVSNVSLKLQAGKVYGLLGPNGAGKSTLLKMMTGQLVPSSGEVWLHEKPLSSFTPEELATHRAVLAQQRAVGFPFKSFDVVMMGRHPHVHGSGESQDDRERVEACLNDTEAGHLSDRIYNTLSGGEAARVDLARVLAQDTATLLLDEPTNHLDPRYQVSVLNLCRSLARAGHAVVVCMHDLNLAAHYADLVMIMKDGETVAEGDPMQVFTPDLLEKVYDIPFSVWPRPGGGICILPESQMVPLGSK